MQAAVGGELEVPQHTGEFYVTQNEVLQAELATIGIKTELKILPRGGIISTEHADANEDFLFQSTTRGGGDTVDHSFLQTFHPGGSQNPYGIDDPVLTEMIERQRGILDLEARREVYHAIEGPHPAEHVHRTGPARSGLHVLEEQGQGVPLRSRRWRQRQGPPLRGDLGRGIVGLAAARTARAVNTRRTSGTCRRAPR